MSEIPVVMSKILDLANKLGITNIREFERGLWEHKLDERWKFAMNGMDRTIDRIPPFSVLVKFNGWPAGIVDFNGGVIAGGAAANEDAFIAVLDAALGDGGEAR